MEERIKYVEDRQLYTSELLDKKVLYIAYLVEIGNVKPIIEDNDRFVLEADINNLDILGDILGTNAAFGSREFGWFYIKVGADSIMIKDGNMNISGEFTKELVDRLIDLMKELNIKRIIAKTYKMIPQKNAIHPAITSIRGVKLYQCIEEGFKELGVKNVYQFFNESGKHFVNGPFQKCKQCSNWFRFSEEEIRFMDSNGIHICKRCRVEE